MLLLLRNEQRPVSEYCHKCGQPLTDEVRGKLKTVTEAVENTLLYQRIMAMVRAEIVRDQNPNGAPEAALPN
jgi:hypothetical protein